MKEMGRVVRLGGKRLTPKPFNVEPSYFLDGKIPKINSFYVLRFLNFGFQNEGGRSEQHVC